MNYIKHLSLILFVCLAPRSLAAAPQPLKTVEYLGFNPATGLNDLPQLVVYQFPDPRRFGPGPYPVFFWTPGTYQSYRDVMSLTFVTQMAARGFIGASVQYSNTNAIQTCSGYIERAKSVYNITQPTSAAAVVCMLPGAACGAGMVTAGISQGGMMSVLAKNFAQNVQASFAMSVSNFNQAGLGVSLSRCMDKQYTAIPANRLMIINGANDPLFGGQNPLEAVSGFTCPPGSTECWSGDGSGAGWYIVQNSEVTDLDAEHCYHMVGGCTGLSFDMNWYLPARNDWSLKPNLDWLSTFGTSRAFTILDR